MDEEALTKHWTDWVDYWAVDFDYMSRKEIIKVPVASGSAACLLPGLSRRKANWPCRIRGTLDRRYIFENEWQSFRTRQNRDLELTTRRILTPGPAATPLRSKSSTSSATTR